VNPDISTITFSAVGAPKAAKGTRLVLRDGTRFVVVSQTGTTVTLVPERWWHKIPWWRIALFVAGFVFGKLLVLWLAS
jgi:hypothetical protein